MGSYFPGFLEPLIGNAQSLNSIPFFGFEGLVGFVVVVVVDLGCCFIFK